ncbi:hypothetical protein F5148DRAFT_1243015 [Russula earlei]|uniref:Uncharacterized protein n=1 Tax=Russula earlei TaxID=71964 RepID=A0ACC0TV69_9AGAM|nr:hypothetical protein F5148DRAFT_1243015 [Russula earlei]
MLYYSAFAVFCFATSVAPAFATRGVLSKRHDGIRDDVKDGWSHAKHVMTEIANAHATKAGVGNGNGNQKREIRVAY